MKDRIRLIDTTLRDGSHAMSHSFTREQVRNIAAGLDEAGVAIIEISHGDGIAGSSINYGFSKTPNMELIEEAASVIKHARLGSVSQRRPGSADCHPCDRGGCVTAAHQSRKKHGHVYGGISDDGAHGQTGADLRAGQAV